MFLSRRLARDRLNAGDVRPYDSSAQICTGDATEIREWTSSGPVELESLDLVKLGPYLLILQAHESAKMLVSSAQAEADMIRQQSRLDGAAQGREEAKEEALPAAVAFANAGQALIVFEQQMIARYTPEMVRLALEIAEKLVHKALAPEPEIVAAVLESARQEVTQARHIRIRLNPQDYELLSEIRPDLLMLGSDAGRVIEVVKDEDLSRGGCRLETEIGVVDATLPTQIAELHRQLLDEESVTKTTDADSIPSSTPNAEVSREL
jgi:flagellar biosynthesis/type III secretory pathway protein FliH